MTYFTAEDSSILDASNECHLAALHFVYESLATLPLLTLGGSIWPMLSFKPAMQS